MVTESATLLATNLGGFEAACTITLAGAPESPRKLSGQILGHGGKIFLEAAPAKSKTAAAAGFGVIWDATSRRGFVFSEALQGYAAFEESVRFTNFLMEAVAGQPETMEGHPVDYADVTATRSDGNKNVLHLAQAKDLGNLPLQIRSDNGADSFVLVLSKVKAIAPAEAMFLPPIGFTRYPSELALVNELADRQRMVLGGHGHAGTLQNPEESIEPRHSPGMVQ